MNALELRLAMNVRDFARSVDFYETLLGMARITAWHDEGEGPGIILRIGPGRTLELFGAPYAEPDAPPVGGGFAIVIQVDDVDAARPSHGRGRAHCPRPGRQPLGRPFLRRGRPRRRAHLVQSGDGPGVRRAIGLTLPPTTA
ncbi:MAG: VOC family protein [Caldilineaceae bacterium]